MLGCSDSWADEKEYFRMTLNEAIHEVSGDNHGKSGAYIFEKGEEALLARGWLTDHATETIDVQYFIWSTDNIGILAAEALLRAAGRGVKVRVLVDDLLIDAPDKIMLSLNAHPNIDIRIYNPKHSVGISILERFWHLLFNFRSANQRMHDKTFTVDNRVSITGGRNMADEYFDYNQIYNFRDRDTLLIGPVVDNVKKNFSTFWTSNLAIPVETILNKEVVTPLESEREKIYKDLHDYASNSKNFETAVRSALHDLHKKFSLLAKAMTWGDVRFIHDVPGKNASTSLTGGSETFDQLVRTVSEAKERIVIQSPYLIMPKDGIKFFKKLIDRGVKVQISTNSLASTDNLQAFSGYSKQRKKILAAGIEVFEFKPNPKIQQELIERYEALKKSIPTFAIHAKTLVIDGEVLFVGTFNLDPRSANLNTEVGVIIKNRNIAIKVEQSILKDMLPENSWNTAKDKPDSHASFTKKIKMYFWRLWPLDRIL
ncbi:MAG: phospholipase D family protein [Desulfobacteraceae bacterium]|nr:phospholipase D family protein [Desulfobacteraceae bacterium]